ncbi:MAG: RluA family pseudouridine synthase [bacterium]
MNPNVKIDIIYEDKDYVAVNKPSGLVVHADGKPAKVSEGVDGETVTVAQEPVLTDWISKHFPETEGVGEPIVMTNGVFIHRPGIVHRLDKGTSGVIVIAKNQKAHAHLKEQFQARSVSKKYYAFVYGEFEDKYGSINRPIGRSKKDFRKYSAQRGARGEMRPAETWYTVVATRGGLDDGTGRRSGSGYSFVEVEPKTGRTHQIRVHFKAVNHPIVCDSLYAPERQCALGFGRPALHSYSIEFIKMDGKPVKIVAPLPADFMAACKELAIDAPTAPVVIDMKSTGVGPKTSSHKVKSAVSAAKKPKAGRKVAKN